MKKPSNEPLRVTPSTMDAFPTSTSHAATGFPTRLSGSSLTTMVRRRALQTPTALNQCRTLPTYTPNPTTNTMKKAGQSPHFPYHRGSASLWWAPQSILPYFTMPSLTMMTGDSPMRSTTTVTSTASLLTPASSSNKCRSTSMPSNRLAPPANLGSCSREHRSKLKDFRTYHVRPRPPAERGSISLVDVVVQPSGGVMLPALRSPAHPDLLHLM